MNDLEEAERAVGVLEDAIRLDDRALGHALRLNADEFGVLFDPLRALRVEQPRPGGRTGADAVVQALPAALQQRFQDDAAKREIEKTLSEAAVSQQAVQDHIAHATARLEGEFAQRHSPQRVPAGSIVRAARRSLAREVADAPAAALRFAEAVALAVNGGHLRHLSGDGPSQESRDIASLMDVLRDFVGRGLLVNLATGVRQVLERTLASALASLTRAQEGAPPPSSRLAGSLRMACDAIFVLCFNAEASTEAAEQVLHLLGTLRSQLAFDVAGHVYAAGVMDTGDAERWAASLRAVLHELLPPAAGAALALFNGAPSAALSPPSLLPCPAAGGSAAAQRPMSELAGAATPDAVAAVRALCTRQAYGADDAAQAAAAGTAGGGAAADARRRTASAPAVGEGDAAADGWVALVHLAACCFLGGSVAPFGHLSEDVVSLLMECGAMGPARAAVRLLPSARRDARGPLLVTCLQDTLFEFARFAFPDESGTGAGGGGGGGGGASTVAEVSRADVWSGESRRGSDLTVKRMVSEGRVVQPQGLIASWRARAASAARAAAEAAAAEGDAGAPDPMHDQWRSLDALVGLEDLLLALAVTCEHGQRAGAMAMCRSVLWYAAEACAANPEVSVAAATALAALVAGPEDAREALSLTSNTALREASPAKLFRHLGGVARLVTQRTQDAEALSDARARLDAQRALAAQAQGGGGDLRALEARVASMESSLPPRQPLNPADVPYILAMLRLQAALLCLPEERDAMMRDRLPPLLAFLRCPVPLVPPAVRGRALKLLAQLVTGPGEAAWMWQSVCAGPEDGGASITPLPRPYGVSGAAHRPGRRSAAAWGVGGPLRRAGPDYGRSQSREEDVLEPSAVLWRVEAPAGTYPATEGYLAALHSLLTPDLTGRQASLLSEHVRFIIDDVLVACAERRHARPGERWRLLAHALGILAAVLRTAPRHALRAAFEGDARFAPARPHEVDPAASPGVGTPASWNQSRADGASAGAGTGVGEGAEADVGEATGPSPAHPAVEVVVSLLQQGPALDAVLGIVCEGGGCAPLLRARSLVVPPCLDHAAFGAPAPATARALAQREDGALAFRDADQGEAGAAGTERAPEAAARPRHLWMGQPHSGGVHDHAHRRRSRELTDVEARSLDSVRDEWSVWRERATRLALHLLVLVGEREQEVEVAVDRVRRSEAAARRSLASRGGASGGAGRDGSPWHGPHGVRPSLLFRRGLASLAPLSTLVGAHPRAIPILLTYLHFREDAALTTPIAALALRLIATICGRMPAAAALRAACPGVCRLLTAKDYAAIGAAGDAAGSSSSSAVAQRRGATGGASSRARAVGSDAAVPCATNEQLCRVAVEGTNALLETHSRGGAAGGHVASSGAGQASASGVAALGVWRDGVGEDGEDLLEEEGEAEAEDEKEKEGASSSTTGSRGSSGASLNPFADAADQRAGRMVQFAPATGSAASERALAARRADRQLNRLLRVLRGGCMAWATPHSPAFGTITPCEARGGARVLAGPRPPLARTALLQLLASSRHRAASGVSQLLLGLTQGSGGHGGGEMDEEEDEEDEEGYENGRAAYLPSGVHSSPPGGLRKRARRPSESSLPDAGPDGASASSLAALASTALEVPALAAAYLAVRDARAGAESAAAHARAGDLPSGGARAVSPHRVLAVLACASQLLRARIRECATAHVTLAALRMAPGADARVTAALRATGYYEGVIAELTAPTSAAAALQAAMAEEEEEAEAGMEGGADSVAPGMGGEGGRRPDGGAVGEAEEEGEGAEGEEAVRTVGLDSSSAAAARLARASSVSVSLAQCRAWPLRCLSREVSDALRAPSLRSFATLLLQQLVSGDGGGRGSGAGAVGERAAAALRGSVRSGAVLLRVTASGRAACATALREAMSSLRLVVSALEPGARNGGGGDSDSGGAVGGGVAHLLRSLCLSPPSVPRPPAIVRDVARSRIRVTETCGVAHRGVDVPALTRVARQRAMATESRDSGVGTPAGRAGRALPALPSPGSSSALVVAGRGREEGASAEDAARLVAVRRWAHAWTRASAVSAHRMHALRAWSEFASVVAAMPRAARVVGAQALAEAITACCARLGDAQALSAEGTDVVAETTLLLVASLRGMACPRPAAPADATSAKWRATGGFGGGGVRGGGSGAGGARRVQGGGNAGDPARDASNAALLAGDVPVTLLRRLLRAAATQRQQASPRARGFLAASVLLAFRLARASLPPFARAGAVSLRRAGLISLLGAILGRDGQGRRADGAAGPDPAAAAALVSGLGTSLSAWASSLNALGHGTGRGGAGTSAQSPSTGGFGGGDSSSGGGTQGEAGGSFSLSLRSLGPREQHGALMRALWQDAGSAPGVWRGVALLSAGMLLEVDPTLGTPQDVHTRAVSDFVHALGAPLVPGAAPREEESARAVRLLQGGAEGETARAGLEYQASLLMALAEREGCARSLTVQHGLLRRVAECSLLRTCEAALPSMGAAGEGAPRGAQDARADRARRVLGTVMEVVEAVLAASPADVAVASDALAVLRACRQCVLTLLLAAPLQSRGHLVALNAAVSVLSLCAGGASSAAGLEAAPEDRAAAFEKELGGDAAVVDAYVCSLLRRLAWADAGRSGGDGAGDGRYSSAAGTAGRDGEQARSGGGGDEEREEDEDEEDEEGDGSLWPDQDGAWAELELVHAARAAEAEEGETMGGDASRWWRATRSVHSIRAHTQRGAVQARRHMLTRRLQQRVMAYVRARCGGVAALLRPSATGPMLLSVADPGAVGGVQRSGASLSDLARTVGSCAVALRRARPGLRARAEELQELSRSTSSAWTVDSTAVLGFADGMECGTLVDAVQQLGMVETESAWLEYIVENALVACMVHVQAMNKRRAPGAGATVETLERELRSHVQGLEEPGNFLHVALGWLRNKARSLQE